MLWFSVTSWWRSVSSTLMSVFPKTRKPADPEENTRAPAKKKKKKLCHQYIHFNCSLLSLVTNAYADRFCLLPSVKKTHSASNSSKSIGPKLNCNLKKVTYMQSKKEQKPKQAKQGNEK